VRGAIVPAARPSPLATYFPVLALEFCQLLAPVNVYDAFMFVNCTSLNTLKDATAISEVANPGAEGHRDERRPSVLDQLLIDL
jgi:hypothetical protein